MRDFDYVASLESSLVSWMVYSKVATMEFLLEIAKETLSGARTESQSVLLMAIAMGWKKVQPKDFGCAARLDCLLEPATASLKVARKDVVWEILKALR